MMKIQYVIPPWVSTRTYGSDSTVRSVIINEQSRDFYTLDAESAQLWSRLEAGATHETLVSHALELGVADDLKDYIDSLVEMGLILIHLSPLSGTPTASSQPPDTSLEPQTTHHQIEEEFKDWVLKQGGLWSLFWEMTYRCNERCVHCFNPGAAHTVTQKPKRSTDELNTAEAKRMIDDAYKIGAFKVCLSGGEVLIRKDFFEIAKHVRQKRMSLTIYTNGLLIDDEALTELADLWPAMVGVSIYSANPDIHDGITKVPGSFQRSIELLKKLHTLGIRTSLKAAIMDQAVQGWQKLEQLAHEIGAAFQMDIQITAGNDGAREPMQLNIQSHAELVALAVTQGSSIYVGDAANSFGRMQKLKDQPVCSAGHGILSINPEGDIYPCVAMPMAVGNVRESSLDDIWSKSMYGNQPDDAKGRLSRWQSVNLIDYHECGTHKRCAYCTTCPGMGLVETGDPLAPSEMQCRIASARMDVANLLEAGYTREAILEKFCVPVEFGTNQDARPTTAFTTHTVTFDPRKIGVRKFDGHKPSP